MKNNYKLLQNSDPDLENYQDNPNQIELTIKDNVNTNTNFQQDICSICLEQNNSSSITLECGCNNKFHSKCIDEIYKHNILKCPLCSQKISNKDYLYKQDIFGCINLLILIIKFCIGLLYFISFFSTFVLKPMSFILYPSELKYCDNHYKKCEYYEVKAIISNNTIIEKYNNFDIKYELLSSYEYNNDFEQKYKTCINLESHVFTSYSEALKVSKKSIGTEKNIYVPYGDKNNCKLTYKFYNYKKFILNVLTFLNFIWCLPMLISIGIIKYSNDYYFNINIYARMLMGILHIIFMLIHLIIQFTFGYYLLVY